MRGFRVTVECLECGSYDTYIDTGFDGDDRSIEFHCYGCGNHLCEDYRIRPGRLPKGVYAEVPEEEEG